MITAESETENEKMRKHGESMKESGKSMGKV